MVGNVSRETLRPFAWWCVALRLPLRRFNATQQLVIAIRPRPSLVVELRSNAGDESVDGERSRSSLDQRPLRRFVEVELAVLASHLRAPVFGLRATPECCFT
jgi:hypothetical protein